MKVFHDVGSKCHKGSKKSKVKKEHKRVWGKIEMECSEMTFTK